jgi:hypothetical protein
MFCLHFKIKTLELSDVINITNTTVIKATYVLGPSKTNIYFLAFQTFKFWAFVKAPTFH